MSMFKNVSMSYRQKAKTFEVLFAKADSFKDTQSQMIITHNGPLT